jgi:hypothetical protein
VSPLQPDNNISNATLAALTFKISLLVLLEFIVDRVRLFKFSTKKEGNNVGSASTRYTLRASGKKNQISHAQFRAKSAEPAVVDNREVGEENSRVAAEGSVHSTTAGASRES